MVEHVWNKRGGPQPLRAFLSAVTPFIRRRSIVLTISSILAVALLTRTPAPFVTGVDSSRNVDTASTVAIGPGLTLHVPPGIRVDACAKCFVGPYLFRRYVPVLVPTGTKMCGAFGLISFASTAATPSMVRARLNSTFHLAEGTHPDPNGGSLRTSAMTIGGNPFTALEYGLSGCRTTIAIGNVYGVTYLVDLMARPADPAVELILSSITFSN